MNEPMYIEVKHYDTTIRINKPNSEQTLDEMVEMMASLLKAMGYDSEQVSERLGL